VTANWPQVPLGDLLTPVRREEPVDASREYRLLGARWYAGGLFLKDVRSGQEIRAARLYRVQSGDFVYNRLFAWKGSFALATDEADGCSVSNEFPCFEIDSTRLEGRFLWSYFRRENTWNEALGLSTGATPTSRNRLKESLFLKMRIPLPTLLEQHRIVARIEELARQVLHARQLRQNLDSDVNALLISHQRTQFCSPNGHSWIAYRLEDVCEAMIDYRGRTPPISESGIPHITSANIREGAILWNTRKFVTEATYDEYMTRGIPRARDVLFTMEAPLGEVGVVPDGRKFSLAQRVILLRPKADILSGDFLAKALSSPDVRDDIFAKATATTVSGIASKRLKEVRLPIPPLKEQSRIVSELNAVQTEVNALSGLQAEIATELDALLPAILDQAFKGEL